MILSPFGRGRDHEEGQYNSNLATESLSGAPTAFIDQGSEFEGKLSFKDTARIDGTFRGEIRSENTLEVGATGVIEATVIAQVIHVSGKVKGDIQGAKMVVLYQGAQVQGCIDTPKLVVHEGAIFNGEIKMSDSGTQLKAVEAGSSS